MWRRLPTAAQRCFAGIELGLTSSWHSVSACPSQEIFNAQMPYLFDRILANHVLLTIPQHFLANAGTTRYFADTLLRFLVDRLELLGEADKVVASITV